MQLKILKCDVRTNPRTYGRTDRREVWYLVVKKLKLISQYELAAVSASKPFPPLIRFAWLLVGCKLLSLLEPYPASFAKITPYCNIQGHLIRDYYQIVAPIKGRLDCFSSTLFVNNSQHSLENLQKFNLTSNISFQNVKSILSVILTWQSSIANISSKFLDENGQKTQFQRTTKQYHISSVTRNDTAWRKKLFGKNLQNSSIEC